jgi:carbon monoxide dehydrogenase subunit G
LKIEGEHRFETPRPAVFAACLDPEVLANTLPGCEKLEPVGENTFAGRLSFKVGPVQGIFEGRVELSEIDPPNGYTMRLEGKGAPGFVNGKGRLDLTDADGGGTLLRYDIDAQVGGRIAGVGQRLLDSSAKVITRQALEGLDREIKRRAEASGARTATEPLAQGRPAPSQARFAADFLGALAGELIPKPYRPLVLSAGAMLLLGAIYLAMRTCSA